MTLRGYQTEAVQRVVNAFRSGERKCLVYMATGSGKTRVMLEISKQLSFDRTFVVVPSLPLCKQMREIFQDRATVVTYHSLRVDDDPATTLCLFDEAHHVTSEVWRKHCMNPWYDFAVFVTATPISRPMNMRMLPTENMHNGVCGPLVFVYSIADAIHDGVLDPFRVVTTRVRESVVDAVLQTATHFGHTRVICFCGRADKRDIAMHDVRSLVGKEWGPRARVCGVIGDAVIGDWAGSAIDFLEEPNADNSNSEIRVLVTCAAMGEGVDTKSCDLVCFCDAKQSPVSIVQNVGRALRRKGKTSSVLLNTPTTDTSSWKNILAVLAAMTDPFALDDIMLKYDNSNTVSGVSTKSTKPTKKKRERPVPFSESISNDPKGELETRGMDATIEACSGEIIDYVIGSGPTYRVCMTRSGGCVVRRANVRCSLPSPSLTIEPVNERIDLLKVCTVPSDRVQRMMEKCNVNCNRWSFFASYVERARRNGLLQCPEIQQINNHHDK
jgi:Type III restriction enzyme, res subunit/Helicase conserved C-terminal domain